VRQFVLRLLRSLKKRPADPALRIRQTHAIKVNLAGAAQYTAV